MSSPATPQPRVGLFGGTFDPVHIGHLILAEQCREQAALDEVWFLPAARPPHKLDHPPTPFTQRVEMLALAVAGNSHFRISEIENERSGPSYTVDTLEELTRRCPTHGWHFIVGADSVPELPRWHLPDRILELAQLLIVARPGATLPPEVEAGENLGVGDGAKGRFRVVRSPLVDVSSRDLRRRAAEGRSLRYLVPHAVEVFIRTHQLYESAVFEG